MKKKSKKTFDVYNLIVEISLMLLIVSVPWFIDLKLSGVMIGKWAFMQLFSGIILLTWLAKFFLDRQIKFLRTKFDLPLLAFLIVSIAATVCSKNPYLSLVGAYYRYEGLITFINYLFLFYVVVNFLNEDSSRRILNVSVFTGGLIGFYGLMQHLHRDLVGWGQYETNRVFSTFGNPVYLGAYTATLLPLAVALCLMGVKKVEKKPALRVKNQIKQLAQYIVSGFTKLNPWLHRISLALITCGLCLSMGRGALIGFAFSMFVFLCLSLRKRDIFITQKVVVTIGIIVLIVGYFNLKPETSSLGRVSQMVNKAVNIQQEKEKMSIAPGEKEFITAMRAAGGARPVMWRDSLRVIKDYPLLGIGPETFGLIFPKYRSLELILTEGGQYGRPDRVHNDIIDLTLSKGFLGLACYLWMVFIFFHLSFKGSFSTNNESRIINIGLLAAGIGYFVQNQSCFWIIPSTSVFFILAGVVARLNTPNAYLLLPEIHKGIKFFICLSIIILVIAVGRLTTNFYLADLEFKQGRDLYFGGAIVDSIPRFEKALALNPRERHYYEYILHAYLDTAQTVKENINKAIESGQRATKFYPQDTIFHNLLGVAYSNNGEIDKTILEYQKILELDPFFSDVRGKLGAIYMSQNKFDLAIEIFKQGLEVNAECGVSLDNLSKIYALQNKTGEAKALLKKLITTNPDNFEAHNNLARIYYDEGNIPAVIDECKEMIRINPENIEAHKNLGSIYFQQGKFQLSGDEFKKVLEIDPNNSYAKNLLLTILSKEIGNR
ncbi:MAG: tetratricopeptide repeat protein [bacterium]|nr:tetratricopeptide repeat protein [bacterium]